MRNRNPRDWGLPKLGTPIGRPAWVRAPAEVPPCQLCGAHLALVSVPMRGTDGRVGTCSYFGCPACPWASPAILQTEQKEEA